MITPELVYEVMGWKEPDLFLQEAAEQNWQRLKHVSKNEGLNLRDLKLHERLEGLARRTGRTTQMIVHAVCKAFEGEKIRIAVTRGQQASTKELINKIVYGIAVRQALPCRPYIEVWEVGRHDSLHHAGTWTVLEDHWLEYQRLHK